MSRQKSYMKYRFFNRLFLYTAFLIAAVIVLVAGVLYAIFSGAMIEDSSRNSLALLRKTSYSADVVSGEVQTLCRALLSDTTIFDYMTAPVPDRVKEFLTLRRLNDIVKVYPYIYRIGIYNADIDRYLTNTGLALDQSVDGASLECLKRNDTGSISFLPQSLKSWPDLNNSGALIPVLTYVVHPGWITEKSEPSGFIIHIQQSYLQDTLDGLNGEGGNLFVMDAKGLILSSSQKNRFLSTSDNVDYVKRILNGTAGEGSFDAAVDGSVNLVTFVRSNAGWTFVSVQPYSRLLENITNVRNLMLAIALAILLAGTVSAFIMARRLYNPIDALLSKLNAPPGRGGKSQDDMALLSDAYSRLNSQAATLQNTIESAIPVFRDAYLRSLLSNPEASLPSAPQLIEQLESSITGDRFFVLLIRIDGYAAYRRAVPEAEQRVHYFALGSIAHDIVGKAYENSVVGTAGDEIALIAQGGAHESPTLFNLALEELHGALAQSFPFTVSMALGDWVDGRSSIHLSCSAAREYVQYRLFYGAGCTVDRSMVIDRLNSPGEYPVEAEDALVSAMERLDQAKAQAAVDKFFRALASMSYENALTYVSQFLMAPVKHFSSLLNVRGETAQSYYRLAHGIAGLQTLDAMAAEARGFVEQILDKLQESKNLCSSQKLKNVLDWINANYQDSNISLEIIADKFEISPGYLGRLLYGVTYSHFNDYLNSLRLNRAAELLKNESLSMEQICKEVGIYNTNYFYTLFKKQYHMTPASYRKKA